MAYTIDLDLAAIQDLQKAIDYYDEQLSGLGRKFEMSIDKHFSALSKNPFIKFVTMMFVVSRSRNFLL